MEEQEIEAGQGEFESSKKQIRAIVDQLAHVEDAELDNLIERFTAIERAVRPATKPKPSFGVSISQLSFSDMAEIWNRDYLQTCLQPGTRQWYREHRGQLLLLRYYGLRLADAIEENLRTGSGNSEGLS